MTSTILQFWSKDNSVLLNSTKSEMINITNDIRSKLLNKKEFIKDKYKVDNNVYFVKQPTFVKMAKIQNRSTIDALYIDYDNKHIIITGKSYNFYNGKPIETDEYVVGFTEEELIKRFPGLN